ncbi:MAG: ATP-dependent DNA ligase [Methanomicrobiales archaeon]
MIKIKFETFTDYLEKLENTTSQTEMIEILSEIFKESEKQEINKICYLILGQIGPEYEDIKLGMDEKMVQQVISLAANVDKESVENETKNLGDIGNTAQKIIKTRENKFKEFFNYKDVLSVNDVYNAFRKIATASGEGSYEIKKKTLASMLIEADQLSKKYIARLANGRMRLGVGDMTILYGLSVSVFKTKEKKDELEHAYNVSSDIGYVAKILFKKGIEGVKRIDITLNKPIKAMLAQRISDFSKIKDKISSENIAAEEKYDGERIQAHKEGKNVKLFSRRLTNVTKQFPDVVEKINRHVKVENVILDGEIVAYDFEDKKFYPFQKLMQRRRKYKIKEYREKIPVKYICFDVLYINNESFLKKCYPDRRKELENVLESSKYIDLAGRVVSSNLDTIDSFFQDCIDRNLEGIVCKSCAEDSYYRAGAREWSWIKWKKEYISNLTDTFDLVIVGAFAGRGRRSGTYGAILCAAYNHADDIFETVTKLGTGFTDKQLEQLPEKLADVLVDKKPARLDLNKNMEPDYYFAPEYVIEALGSEITKSPVHTCNWNEEEKQGMALRFPRFIRWRGEKSPEQATTSEEILQMYEEQ